MWISNPTTLLAALRHAIINLLSVWSLRSSLGSRRTGLREQGDVRRAFFPPARRPARSTTACHHGPERAANPIAAPHGQCQQFRPECSSRSVAQGWLCGGGPWTQAQRQSLPRSEFRGIGVGARVGRPSEEAPGRQKAQPIRLTRRPSIAVEEQSARV